MKRALLSQEERILVGHMRDRLWGLCKEARSLNVRIMVDAEQTYFQPVIDSFVMELMSEFNHDYPCVFSTYQCYLKDSHLRLSRDIERCRRSGVLFGAKLVRGAYLVAEKQRAIEKGLPSPIHNSLQDTHDSYHKNLDYMLERHTRCNVMIASHNQTSVERAIELMQTYGIKPEDEKVYFGQLLGMADHLTFTLGAHGYKAYKYVPYGPIKEVMPYLIRRAQENNDIMGGVGKEYEMLKDCAVHRIFGV